MKNEKGFTLIELIMVIVIIGILAAIAVPRFMDLQSEAKKSACEGNAGSLRAAITSYYASATINDVSTIYPSALASNIVDSNYIGSWPADPLSATWNTHYTAATGNLDIEDACTAP
ncbi:MAG: type II secretion system protein [Candidatus Omnitrophota bacterium]